MAVQPKSVSEGAVNTMIGFVQERGGGDAAAWARRVHDTLTGYGPACRLVASHAGKRTISYMSPAADRSASMTFLNGEVRVAVRHGSERYERTHKTDPGLVRLGMWLEQRSERG